MIAPIAMAYPAHLDAATRASLDRFAAVARERLSIVELRLYGSRARGDAREDSDVDIAIVYDEPGLRPFQIVEELSWIATDILLEQGRVLSQLPIPAAVWVMPEDHPNPYLLRTIRREGVVL